MSFARNEQIADFLNLYECSHPRIDDTSPGWDAHARLRRDVIARHHCGNTALGRLHRNEPRVIWDAPLRGHRVRILVTPYDHFCSRCWRKHSTPIPWAGLHLRVSLRGVDFALLTVSARTAR